MVSEYNAVYKCGWCKKETPIEDNTLGDYIDGPNPKLERTSPCSCGHFSYCSSIKFKAQFDPKDWKFRIGGLE